ncbi:ABC-type multidrug transport system, ATPase component [Flavobacterium limnosediminis JC2902]|uniref:ABC-type multidrug transport system, ATPase component n=1 Tax=Flavobacterium limnosediminis JC2902 TaxID=1341181 RepID=V6SGW2_9FLAO|nr:ABC transporter ATP-binding protein [Flavobacterium limnosediminis]ESU25816.1 ABC-type multidrug transport system, ATPase component [Flavobacterium limnosediminis JC2902]
MIISGHDLSKSYDNRKVLDSVNISCATGEICGLLGANGAGKTTLFKILFGLVTPDSGTVQISANRVKPIGGIIEKPALYEYLNAYDNLKIFGSIQGVNVNQDFLISELSKVGLPLDRKDPVRNFSMGMKQRLGIAIALLNNPACLVLDEPFTGLDPLGVATLRKLIVDLAEKENLAIILSSHIIGELSAICNTLYVLKEGRIVNTGPAQKLIADNTGTYRICAENISSSQSLKAYEVSFKDNCALVSVSTEMVAELIRQLYLEGICITSCSPELSLERLFETATI